MTFTNIFSTIINSLNLGVTCNSVYWFDRPGERIPQKISISWAEVIIRVKCHHQSQLSLVRQISSTESSLPLSAGQGKKAFWKRN